MRTFALLLLSLILSGCSFGDRRPQVLVTMSDGQRLMGRLTTDSFALDTGMGSLSFDATVAGELGPVEGGDVKAAAKKIRLWLKNGSEFVGTWQEPAVELELDLGERKRLIKVPIDKLARLQFYGEPIYTDEPLFRIRTSHGDDFYVDVTRTRLELTSDLGQFDPYLGEIDRLEPIGADGKRWRIRMESGTVLIGTLAREALDLRLAVGPEQIALPVGAVKQMARQHMMVPGRFSAGMSIASDVQAEASIAPQSAPAKGFYDNSTQRALKRAQPFEQR